jgi:hypothetical protein
LVDNDAGLGEAVHAALNFDIYMSVVDKREEVVCLNDFLGDDVDWESHVLIAAHGGSQVEVFNVAAHVLGVGTRTKYYFKSHCSHW